eukprot:1157627-Pelagomonas_calceolata.AAC.8
MVVCQPLLLNRARCEGLPTIQSRGHFRASQQSAASFIAQKSVHNALDCAMPRVRATEES